MLSHGGEERKEPRMKICTLLFILVVPLLSVKIQVRNPASKNRLSIIVWIAGVLRTVRSITHTNIHHRMWLKKQ